MKIFLKKIWIIIKSYWFVPALVVVSYVFVSRRGKIDKIIKTAQESSRKQIDAIISAEDKKKQESKKIEEEYIFAVDAVKKKYKEQKKVITKEKLNKIKKITKEHYNDKEKISQEITNEFGFVYVPPKNNSDS